MHLPHLTGAILLLFTSICSAGPILYPSPIEYLGESIQSGKDEQPTREPMPILPRQGTGTFDGLGSVITSVPVYHNALAPAPADDVPLGPLQSKRGVEAKVQTQANPTNKPKLQVREKRGPERPDLLPTLVHPIPLRFKSEPITPTMPPSSLKKRQPDSYISVPGLPFPLPTWFHGWAKKEAPTQPPAPAQPTVLQNPAPSPEPSFHDDITPIVVPVSTAIPADASSSLGKREPYPLPFPRKDLPSTIHLGYTVVVPVTTEIIYTTVEYHPGQGTTTAAPPSPTTLSAYTTILYPPTTVKPAATTSVAPPPPPPPTEITIAPPMTTTSVAHPPPLSGSTVTIVRTHTVVVYASNLPPENTLPSVVVITRTYTSTILPEPTSSVRGIQVIPLSE